MVEVSDLLRASSLCLLELVMDTVYAPSRSISYRPKRLLNKLQLRKQQLSDMFATKINQSLTTRRSKLTGFFSNDPHCRRIDGNLAYVILDVKFGNPNNL